METRLAVIGIIVEDLSVTDHINNILHDYGSYIVGRMGVPYRQRGVSVISVIIDAPNGVISALTGKVGMLQGVSAKAVYAPAQPQ
ncbi:iron-only hydrogenase system regulator [Pseudoflavonifractor capillosus]|uniref:TM1266 family iron-only hydrogenase system putative regulator n=1 Tax=Pseudoflavonifractor capillosus TaxID=106588 RepID=UPI00195948D8|nr:TM1266 family iron-only hydrogenase system putative regulator [Pseudoflavonifractor capillosus]MBM6897460.1 iron-only hydrogenase system regulator [Pseudoflavonifractor capillosus]